MSLKKLLLICTASISFMFDASAQTMQEAVQQTINENPEIQSLRSERSAVVYEIDQAKASYLPKIDLAAGVGWDTETRDSKNHTEEASLRMTQMIFDGMATPNEVARQTARSDSRSYGVFRQAEISALQAIDAYLGVLRTNELLSLSKENLAIHVRIHDQIQLRAKQGIGKQADADQAAGRLALAEKNVLSEIGNLRDAGTKYQRVIGSLPINLLLPADPTEALPKSREEALKLAISNHPTLKVANADISSAFSQHDTAKATYMPSLDFEAGVKHDNFRDDSYAMLRLRYNLFNGGKDLARRKETSEQVNQAKEIRDSTYRQVIESMGLSWTAHQTLKRQLAFFAKHRDASILSNAAYQKQFNIGQRTLLDLLDSANEMFSTKSAYTNAMYDNLFSQFRILRSRGALTRYLGITLPEEASTLLANKETREAREQNLGELLSIGIPPFQDKDLATVQLDSDLVPKDTETSREQAQSTVTVRTDTAPITKLQSTKEIVVAEVSIDKVPSKSQLSFTDAEGEGVEQLNVDSDVLTSKSIDTAYTTGVGARQTGNSYNKASVSEVDHVLNENATQLTHNESSFGLKTAEEPPLVITVVPNDVEDVQALGDYSSLCYELNTESDLNKLQRLVNEKFHKYEIVDQDKKVIYRYILLTPQSSSMKESFKQELALKKLGFTGLWMFKEGEYKGRISPLSLFKLKENAEQEQVKHAKRGAQFDVVPRYKVQQNKIINIKLLNSEITTFEAKFSAYINKKSECVSEILIN